MADKLSARAKRIVVAGETLAGPRWQSALSRATGISQSLLAMIASGFFVGKWLNMYPVEAAIVTACHSGLGGTGDVAILGAADRMGLMAFAQIATRVGGAIMIVIATLAMKIAY